MPTFNTPITTNDQSIGRVLANPLPVLLVLNGSLPDSNLTNVLNELASAEAGKLLIAKVLTAENPIAAHRCGSIAATTLILWKAGAEQSRLSNPTPDDVRQAAKYLLGHGPLPTAKPPAASRSSTGDASAPIKVSEGTFNQLVLHSDVPVLVDFWAAWCGPCRMIAPTLEKLAGEYQGRVKIAKVNVDENPGLAVRYGAQSIPLLVMFKGGQPIDQLLGAHPEPNIRNLIERALTRVPSER